MDPGLQYTMSLFLGASARSMSSSCHSIHQQTSESRECELCALLKRVL